MFTPEQYRAKAAQYDALLKTAGTPAEEAEYRDLKQSYGSLAENLDWLAANSGKTVGSGKQRHSVSARIATRPMPNRRMSCAAWAPP